MSFLDFLKKGKNKGDGSGLGIAEPKIQAESVVVGPVNSTGKEDVKDSEIKEVGDSADPTSKAGGIEVRGNLTDYLSDKYFGKKFSHDQKGYNEVAAIRDASWLEMMAIDARIAKKTATEDDWERRDVVVAQYKHAKQIADGIASMPVKEENMKIITTSVPFEGRQVFDTLENSEDAIRKAIRTSEMLYFGKFNALEAIGTYLSTGNESSLGSRGILKALAVNMDRDILQQIYDKLVQENNEKVADKGNAKVDYTPEDVVGAVNFMVRDNHDGTKDVVGFRYLGQEQKAMEVYYSSASAIEPGKRCFNIGYFDIHQVGEMQIACGGELTALIAQFTVNMESALNDEDGLENYPTTCGQIPYLTLTYDFEPSEAISLLRAGKEVDRQHFISRSIVNPDSDLYAQMIAGLSNKGRN